MTRRNNKWSKLEQKERLDISTFLIWHCTSTTIYNLLVVSYTAISTKVVPQKRKSVRDKADWYFE